MEKLRKIFNLVREPIKIFSVMGRRDCFKWIPDKIYLQILFYAETGKHLNLKNPRTFNEKLQWIKLYDRKPEYSTYVDKYAVREYIGKTIGEEFLVPILGLYETVDEIPWNDLPNQFVIKCTHGSGSNIICIDKSRLNIEESKRKLKRWMKRNWYWLGREWPYKNVKPRIICEKYISDNNTVPNDLKVLCFNGKAKLIQLHNNRFSKNHTQTFYSLDWKKTQISQGGSFFAPSATLMPSPACLNEMLRISEILAKDKYHVRIDWYEVNSKLYFGEITFFDGSGFALFDNPQDDIMLGSWIDLCKINWRQQGDNKIRR